MISTLKGDITGLDFDIIVNAANEQLRPGGGVCGAIFRKAGNKLVKACKELNGCETGHAKMTPAFDLPSKVIIHAVGPVYKDGQHNEAEYLKAAYWNSMVLAYDYLMEHNLDKINIAFPCISTGIYGYPHEEACKIAVKTIKKLYSRYPETKAIQVVFVCYQQEDYRLYKEELKKI